MDNYITPDEAAKMLQVSRPTFERDARKLGLKKFRKPKDRHVYYSIEDVQKIKQDRDSKYSAIPNLAAALAA